MPLPNLKHPLWRYLGIGIVVVVAGWFLIGRIFPSYPPGPTTSEKTADSLAATKPADKALIDSSNARIVARQAVSDRATDAARIAQDRANSARRRADSLAIAKQWDSAYVARTEEADSLRSVTVSDATIIFALKADTVDLRSQLGIVNKRLKTTEDVNQGLRKDLDKARQCKIVAIVFIDLNCPSRIQTVAMTAVVFYAADRYRSR